LFFKEIKSNPPWRPLIMRKYGVGYDHHSKTPATSNTNTNIRASAGLEIQSSAEEKKDGSPSHGTINSSILTLATAKDMSVDDINEHVRICQRKYKGTLVLVVVFAEVDVDNIETARALVESSRDAHMPVMFTKAALDKTTLMCQLVIYEIATRMHEQTAAFLGR
jgi:hypothetical protein